MPSSFIDLNVHVVFSTKNRHPYFAEDTSERLHEYLGGTIRGLEAQPIRVGGVADHVHLLFGFRATHSIAVLVREIKKSSTAWVRSDLDLRTFTWQEGYAAFSVSQERIAMIDRYIQRQAEHHRKKTFEEELAELLKFAKIDFTDDSLR